MPAAGSATFRRALRADPAVRYVEPNAILHADDVVPNDPGFSKQWALRNTGQIVGFSPGTPGADIHAAAAWDVTTGSTPVTVGVIDTGMDLTHADLAGNVWANPGENCPGCRTDGIDNDGNGYIDDWRGWNFVTNTNDPSDDNGHGTHVAGIIGAVGNNGKGASSVDGARGSRRPTSSTRAARDYRNAIRRSCTPPTVGARSPTTHTVATRTHRRWRTPSRTPMRTARSS